VNGATALKATALGYVPFEGRVAFTAATGNQTATFRVGNTVSLSFCP
jgi:hypothetical protein